MPSFAFLPPLGAALPTRHSPLPSAALRRAHRPAPAVRMSAERPTPRRLPWLRLAAIAAGGLAGSVAPAVVPPGRVHAPPAHAASAPMTVTAGREIPLRALGVRREDYVSERELRRRKTTQYSEAEQEIMELEEWEVATQWFRDLQMTWAALASVGGIFVLYKGGVMWERWIKEQEQKDMEEEIELTGTFIDPRAVRKDEDDTGGKDGKGKPQGQDPKSGGDPNDAPSSQDNPADGLDSLEKLFGKS